MEAIVTCSVVDQYFGTVLQQVPSGFQRTARVYADPSKSSTEFHDIEPTIAGNQARCSGGNFGQELDTSLQIVGDNEKEGPQGTYLAIFEKRDSRTI